MNGSGKSKRVAITGGNGAGRSGPAGMRETFRAEVTALLKTKEKQP